MQNMPSGRQNYAQYASYPNPAGTIRLNGDYMSFAKNMKRIYV